MKPPKKMPKVYKTGVTGSVASKPVPVVAKSPAPAATPEKIAIISTSDRNAFRACRRKWNWSSHLRHGYAPKAQRHPLWFGSGMHHCLEDMHGHQQYASIEAGVDDYLQATTRHYGLENLPETIETDRELMIRMLKHYKYGFLKKRSPLKTYMVKGEPQVEVPFEFEIPVPAPLLRASGYDRVIYRGTMDRIVVDDDGYLWIVDYKNVARFTPSQYLELDSQIGIYLWAAAYIYKRPVIGFIYTQLRKAGVESPRVLKSGLLSSAKDQSTTHELYRAALKSMYGETGWPEDNVQCLNYLASLESDESDKFIQRDWVSRPLHSHAREADKVLAEISEMLDPALKIYPNPDHECHRMCSFMEPCIQMDRGESYQSTLQVDYMQRDYSQRNEWRQYLKVGVLAKDKPALTVRGDTRETKQR